MNAIYEALNGRLSGVSQTSHADSSSLIVPVAKNVSVAVYPKADTRLRIELRHTNKIRAVYQRLARTSIYPNREIGDIAPFLSFLHGKAAERLDRLFSPGVMTELTGTRNGPVAFTGLLNAIVRRCGNNQLAISWILLGLLVHGRVVEEPWHPLRDECEGLIEDHVLVRVRSAQRERYRAYVIHPNYEELLTAIRTSLTTRADEP